MRAAVAAKFHAQVIDSDKQHVWLFGIHAAEARQRDPREEQLLPV